MCEKCKCKSCKKYGNCEHYEKLVKFIKPNTELFNYNVKLANCYLKRTV